MAEIFSFIDQTGQMDRMFVREMPNLVESTDLVALVGGIGDTMGNIQNIHL
jgi:hypothetical protein